MSDRHGSAAPSTRATPADGSAADTYVIVEQRQSRIRRWPKMAAFWVMALLSMGSPMPIPSTRSWAITRRSDGVVVTNVDEAVDADQSMGTVLNEDLARLSTKDFEDAWGIK